MPKNKFPKIVIIILLAMHGFINLPLGTEAQEQAAPAQAKTEPKANLISLNLSDVAIEDVLKIISEASGLNIILDKDVRAAVNINIKDVPWQIALDNILQTNDLTYKMQNNIIRVMTLDAIKKEQEKVPLVTKIITLNFAKTDELKKSLEKMLSSRGSIEVNVPTNSLIVNDIPDVLTNIEDIANKLDIKTPQVMIEALIMSVKLTNEDQFGIDWTATHKQRSERQFQQSLAPTESALDIYYGKTILPGWNFRAQIALYAQDKKVSILATPRVLTLDNLPAQIKIAEAVPYTSTSSSTQGGTVTSTQFKEAAIILNVTPHITKDNFISLAVHAEQSYVASYIGDSNEPAIDSRTADTNLMLKDGETVVIGGLRKKDNTTTIEKVPILGDIPFIGRIFRKENKELVDTELMIFITPHIITDRLSVDEEKKFEKSRAELFDLDKKDPQASRGAAIAEALNKATLQTFPKETK